MLEVASLVISASGGQVNSGEQLFIGVDGGGSGCRARIENAQGRVLGTGIAGPAAVRLGLHRAMAALETACRAAAANAGLGAEKLGDMHAVIGLAGVERKGVLETLKARPHPFRSVHYVSDAMIACVGAHGGRDGGVVIIGTGSIGFTIVDGRTVRVGGYGFPISDEGSGANLGLQAIRRALSAYDGRIVATDFTRAVMARFDDDPFDAVAWMEHATATDYATLAPLVMQHAEDGDPLARRIVQEAVEQISALARRLLDYGASRIALLGGLATPIEPWLAPDIRRFIVPSEGDAIAGALHLAKHAEVALWG